MTTANWIKKCQAAADAAVNADVMFHETAELSDVFEDDFCLHVKRKDLPRASFGVGSGQEDALEFNAMVRSVLPAIGIGTAKWKPEQWRRVLVDVECQECDGGGKVLCKCCEREDPCDECEGEGFIEPLECRK